MSKSGVSKSGVSKSSISKTSISKSRISKTVSSSTWDSSVKKVHTWSRLATEGICSVGIRMAEAISVASVQECWVSLSFTIDGGDEGRCNNKELIHFVR